jgi:hypothetical protein
MMYSYEHLLSHPYNPTFVPRKSLLQSQLEISLKAPWMDKLHYARGGPSQDWEQCSYRKTQKRSAQFGNHIKMSNVAAYRTEQRQQRKVSNDDINDRERRGNKCYQENRM